MKNTITIIVPIILGYFLSSCGTTTGLTTAVYQDAIYQKPDANGYIVVNTNNDKEIEVLRGKTKESNGVYINGKLVEPLYVDEKGNVNIDISGEEVDKTYLVLNPGESFEERLTKFENPQYTINITYDPFDNYYSWYYANPFHYWRFGNYWGSFWYNPWRNYGRYYGYFSIDPFIGMDYFWWSSMYMPIYHRPWDWYYASWHYPGDGYGYWCYNWNDPDRYRYTSSRDFYYGRRESQRSDKNNSTAVVSGGSYIRREANVQQVRGERPYNGNLNSSESLYRRDNRFESQNSYQGNEVRREGSQVARSNNGQSNDRGYTSVRRVSSEITRGSGSYNRNEETLSGGGTSVNRGNSSSVSRGNSSSVSRESSSSIRRNNESSYRNSGVSTSSRSGNSGSSANYRPSENQRSVNTGTNTYSRSSGSNNSNSYNSSGARFDSGSSSRGYVNTSSGASSAGSSSGSSSNTSSSSSSGSSYRR